MMRRFAAPTARRAIQRRAFVGPLGSNLAAHVGEGIFVGTCLTPAGFLASPFGTAAMLAVAYNVSVTGLKHLHWSMDLTTRDYIQDPVLAQVIRYALFISLISCVGQVFVEA